MWLEKLTDGFLQVLTDQGPHFVKLSFTERLRLIWMFRNFSILPQQVLTPRQQRLLSEVCAEERMFQFWGPEEAQRGQVIGTIVGSVLPSSRLEERRVQPRCPVMFEVRYGLGKDLMAGEGNDFGGGGLAFSGPKSYPPGTELELRYRLTPQENWTRVRALVRHRQGDRMGVEFLALTRTRRGMPAPAQPAAKAATAKPHS